ncbi:MULTISPECIES: alpha/beta hydrolase [unclassified Mycobacterium]|uniref:PHA/PHB synthase family protein n=1 Tax=unclassified Mycobacterium TaxID=2642494 RepID=UPI0007405541|nr:MULTISPECIES: alpha/beta hydrolase [unclassified Mycobacterium]KUH85563.1 hypothetical protein AU186_22710 [Mycobacterium sp. GA-1999]KUH91421.1 hypothetical protein AU185_09775 [Mycobacterium sp. GA-0227b]KUH96325.1 hypothetical protein AU187_14070 [Mycobacterium sp. IS-1556]
MTAPEASAGIDVVLAASAFETVRDRIPAAELLRMAGAIVRRPGPAAQEVTELARRLASITRGSDTPADRRFTDRAWQDNPLMRRLAMSYLASCAAVERIVIDADVDWRTKERVRLFVDNVLAAAAPTNNPLANPSSLKQAIDTGATSWIRGLRHLSADMRSRPRIPALVDSTQFTAGENIAATPGKVVLRNDLFELIQYQPTTERVDEVPVLMVASPVNKYYLLDLNPKTSVIAAEVARGRQVFVASWVNPDPQHADADLDAYVRSVMTMLDAIADICGCARSHLLGLCGGGLIALAAAGYLAACGQQDRLATLTLGIAVIDFERGGLPGALLDRKIADRAIKRAERAGYFDGLNTAAVFAWLRPNEGIWANVVNNYLLGERPPAIEMLYWAADQTNLTAALGRDLLEITLGNSLTVPGAVEVLGLPLDLSKMTVDTYVLGASTDHITPWRDCYRTRSVVGAATTFVLARGGHAVAIATPRGAPKGSYRTGDSSSAEPDEWLSGSTETAGSWWDHWNDWIAKRTPEKRPAPAVLGSHTHPPLGDAPGDYVKRRLE